MFLKIYEEILSPSRYFSMNLLGKAGKILFNRKGDLS